MTSVIFLITILSLVVYLQITRTDATERHMRGEMRDDGLPEGAPA